LVVASNECIHPRTVHVGYLTNAKTNNKEADWLQYIQTSATR
jgi:hypothetical protein